MRAALASLPGGGATSLTRFPNHGACAVVSAPYGYTQQKRLLYCLL